jgi:ATP-dependent Clp protease ATP-binding subunit ClpB
VRIQLGRLQELLDSRKIQIDVTDMAVSWLAETGYNPEYGARPLKRVIQRYLQDPLAVQLLEGTIKDGDKLTITCGENGLSFTDHQLAAA